MRVGVPLKGGQGVARRGTVKLIADPETEKKIWYSK